MTTNTSASSWRMVLLMSAALSASATASLARDTRLTTGTAITSRPIILRRAPHGPREFRPGSRGTSTTQHMIRIATPNPGVQSSIKKVTPNPRVDHPIIIEDPNRPAQPPPRR